MIAVMTALEGFPAPMSWRYFFKPGLKRIATRAGHTQCLAQAGPAAAYTGAPRELSRGRVMKAP